MTEAAPLTARFERGPGLRRVIIPAARVLGRCYFRARVSGAEQIPRDRPVIYVGKHPRSFLYVETVLLGLYAFWDSGRPPFRVLEKTGTTIHRTPLLGWFRRRVNAVPASEEHALDALAHGESLLIYPGGTRELYGPRDALQWQGRTGFARLALRSGAPVVPFAIVGADRQHLGRVALRGASLWLPPFPLPVRLEFRFGAPIAPAPGGDATALAERAEVAVRALLHEAGSPVHRGVRAAPGAASAEQRPG